MSADFQGTTRYAARPAASQWMYDQMMNVPGGGLIHQARQLPQNAGSYARRTAAGLASKLGMPGVGRNLMTTEDVAGRRIPIIENPNDFDLAQDAQSAAERNAKAVGAMAGLGKQADAYSSIIKGLAKRPELARRALPHGPINKDTLRQAMYNPMASDGTIARYPIDVNSTSVRAMPATGKYIFRGTNGSVDGRSAASDTVSEIGRTRNVDRSWWTTDPAFAEVFGTNVHAIRRADLPANYAITTSTDYHPLSRLVGGDRAPIRAELKRTGRTLIAGRVRDGQPVWSAGTDPYSALRDTLPTTSEVIIRGTGAQHALPVSQLPGGLSLVDGDLVGRTVRPEQWMFRPGHRGNSPVRRPALSPEWAARVHPYAGNWAVQGPAADVIGLERLSRSRAQL